MPLFLPSAGMICAEKALILDGNVPIWLYISSVKYIGAGRKWGERLGNDWEMWLRRMPPEREDK